MRVVFIGDSLTWGGYGGDYVSEISKLAPQHEIVNMGRGGYTVINLVELVDRVINQEPDMVFVMVGGNDAIAYCQPKTRPYYEQARGIPDGIVTPNAFIQNYRDLLTQLQLAHILVRVGLPPLEYNHETVETMREFNALARTVAESMNIPVIDFMAHFPPEGVADREPLSMTTINLIGKRSSSGWDDFEAERDAGGFTFSFDGIHLTPEYAKKIAALLVDFLDLNDA